MTIIPSATMIETFTGRFVDTKAPTPDTICIDDIAHALSNTCRFGGHCQLFYSVAEHAVLVSKRLEQKNHSLSTLIAGLHHDDAEAYLGDIPRPMKGLLGATYARLTTRMNRAIVQSLALGGDIEAKMHGPDVKDADNWALLLEARFLLPSRGINWTAAQKEEWNVDFADSRRIRTPDFWMGGLTPSEARRTYLARHAELVFQ